jgi:putative cell wall-binding protein
MVRLVRSRSGDRRAAVHSVTLSLMRHLGPDPRRARRVVAFAAVGLLAAIATLSPAVPATAATPAIGAGAPAPATAPTSAPAPGTAAFDGATAVPPTVVAPMAVVSQDRVAGADRYATAVAISARLAPDGGVPLVVLVSGEDFADALAAGPAAAAAHGVVLLTRRDELPAVVAAELARLAPERVVVAGGPTAVTDAVAEGAATASGVEVERVAGADRYATAAALSAATFDAGKPGTVFLATGGAYPDALAAGAIAAARGWPILLTAPDRLPPATATELRRLGPERVVVVGGPSAVGAAVVDAVGRLGPTVSRVAGADRYATAAAIAARFAAEAPAAVIATGGSFPDALAGAPLAATLGAPVLLSLADRVPAPTRDRVRAAKPTALTALGGPTVIRDAVLNELAGWSDGRLFLPGPGPDWPAYQAGFHNYPEMVSEIHVAEVAYPDIVDVFSLGKSYGGREIWAAKVSDEVATDEPEPEVMIDALHHGREHLTTEQALYLLRVLTADYETDPLVRRLVDGREIWIVFAVNPDGFEYDLTGDPYRLWRKNRQPNPGSSYVGTDLNRNYDYRWGCCGGSSGYTSSWQYRGRAPFSAPETRVIRDFVDGRVVDGRQQIRAHISLHTNGELVLWPYGYTKTDIPIDMTRDDHAAFVALGRGMAIRNGYRPEQSSDLYVTDGDEIDWMYGRHRIFSFTWELFPTEQLTDVADHYETDENLGPQVRRNRSALLYLIDQAACPYAASGRAATHCGPFLDDFEIDRGWQRDPDGTDTATAGAWQRGHPAATSTSGPKQLGSAASGWYGLFTDAAAGSTAGSHDLDGGVTTIRSGPIALPTSVGALAFRAYLAHEAGATADDWLRVWVEAEDGARTLVWEETAGPEDDDAAWASPRVSLGAFAESTIRLVIGASDGGGDSLVEAGIDDIRIERP